MIGLVLLSTVIGHVFCHQLNPDIGLTDQEKQKFLDLHNEARRRQGASNMYELEWDEHLAIIAWRWAQNCTFTHGQNNNDYGADIGQNLYVTEGDTNKYGAVNTWIYESAYYDYDSATCSKPPCGHYTMAAWAGSYKLGCAYAACPKLWWPEKNKHLTDAHNIVCHYWPAGNIVGMKPFKKGPSCSQCENGRGFCKDGLCQSFCEKPGPSCECTDTLACDNCGEVDKETCTCKCAKGFKGKWCKDVCHELDERCPNFQRAHCDNPKYGDTIKQLCPIVCGLCEYQDDKTWTCQGKSWADVFGVVNVLPYRDEQGCHFPFLYHGRYHDGCLQDARGFICSTSWNLDVYHQYKHCRVINTFAGTANGAPCKFPFIYKGEKQYKCIQLEDKELSWCSTTRHYHTDGKWGLCSDPSDDLAQDTAAITNEKRCA